MSLSGIEYLLELLVELDEVAVNSLESFKLAHHIQLLVNLTPLDVVQPVGRIWFRFNRSTRSREEEPPLLLIDLVVTEQYLGTEQE